ncbi:MAG: SDR family oxidoreductase [Dehalococcoidia bacterium]|jgi:NAD(P)-dependent dehydrogenase (short-subunit alcohol dehydrogenase family)|nr:SDR family oxidoreductase [Dehalococcoidia bacterium]
MDLELAGKVAIVTGGSRGIGKAVARQLAAEGADVAIAARTEETLRETAVELGEETGQRILPVIVDTGDDSSVRSMVDAVVAEFGRVDVLVNSAAVPGGGGPPPALEAITAEAFWADMNVKVLGYIRCAQAVSPHMKQQGWGRIVNISGLAARSAGSTIGSMRNVSVAALTKNLANELGPDGINVTVVHPGMTYTERMPELFAARAEAQGISVEEAEQQFASGNSIRHLVTAEEVASVIAFLSSPRSIAINGDAIAVGGGAGTAIHY